MHPSKKIINPKGVLSGKKIVLGLTGSIAVYKSIDLIRELMRLGAEVKVIMSKSAEKLISKELIHFACGEKPLTFISGAVEHVTLMGLNGEADALLIAPCTASSISKIASGFDDGIVTTFALTALSSKPVIIVPAMHSAMNENPFVQKNIQELKNIGVFFVAPRKEDNKLKFPLNKEIILNLRKALNSQKLNKKVLVISGASQEKIDSIRVITNNSSGKTGELIAENAFIHGAKLTLITSSNYDSNLFKVIKVNEFQDFFNTALNELNKEKFDLVFVPAALNDFKVKEKNNKKISSKKIISLNLIPNKKLIQEIRKKFPKIFLCSFKAETNKSMKELELIGKKLLKEKISDLIVLNNSTAFSSLENEILIVSKNNSIKIKGKKKLIAIKLIEEIEKEMN
jgi:phosphopantothenoylcysteine decarboxylase / phosphopantothenate---cysteine ligase